jgi:hypothetical protein
MIIKINNLFTKILLFSGILSMASCLKDDAVDNKEIGVTGTEGQEWVSIPKASKTKTINVFGIESVDRIQHLSLFEVAYDYVNPTNADISVTLAVDNSLVTTADPNAVILPTSVYTIPSLTVKIPAGKRLSESFILDINTFTLDPTEVYGIGLKLSTVSPSSARIASTLNSIVLEFTVKNRWDGEYEVTGTMVDAGSAALTGLFPMNYWMITSGALTSDGYDPVYWEDYFIPIRSGTAVSGYGSFSPVFYFDANNNIVDVKNIYGQPAGNGRYAELDPSGVNKYDPVTKTIKVKFFMFQPSVVSLPNPRVRFDWTMVYKKPRP